MVALGNPGDGYYGNSYDDQSYQDLTARYQIRGNYGFYSIAGVLRNIEDDEAGETKLTGAVSLSARIPTIGRDDLRLQYSYGRLVVIWGCSPIPTSTLVLRQLVRLNRSRPMAPLLLTATSGLRPGVRR